jgi:hypothetical protein
MGKLFVASVLIGLLQLTGCNDSPKPRQPPAGVVSETDTVEELRERRRVGEATTPPTNSPRDRESTASSGGSRRTPEERQKRAKAAKEAEAARDAQADRPTRVLD